MKRKFTNLIALSILALTIGCSGNPSNPFNSKDSSSVNTVTSSANSIASLSSVKSSSNPSSSSKKSSSSRKPELSTASGLVVSFNAKGARIESIKWGQTKIADRGFVVGRCANRIANGTFVLNGTTYNVTKNVSPHSLHGGGTSWEGPFANANWTLKDQTDNSIRYELVSADNDNGYPGEMRMNVTYTLSQTGELSIEYRATTTKDTLCNPTNHLFMNINGDSSYNNVKLWIDADEYTPLSSQIPTGQIATVSGTKFDYSTEKAFDGNKDYDDNYVLNGEGYRKVATLSGTSLGLKVDVFTDRPGLQLYKAGSGSICLETQMFPDMINHAEFDSYGTTILRANEEFYSKTTYAFSSLS